MRRSGATSLGTDAGVELLRFYESQSWRRGRRAAHGWAGQSCTASQCSCASGSDLVHKAMLAERFRAGFRSENYEEGGSGLAESEIVCVCSMAQETDHFYIYDF